MQSLVVDRIDTSFPGPHAMMSLRYEDRADYGQEQVLNIHSNFHIQIR